MQPSTGPAPTARKRRIIHGLDLAGWDAIAGAIDVSIRTAQKLTKLRADPLPVKILAGRARASSEALVAWVERNARRVGGAADRGDQDDAPNPSEG